jgi:hypothetical protein
MPLPATTVHRPRTSAPHPASSGPGVGATLGGLAFVAAVGWCTRASPGWLAMWAIASAELLTLKLITLRGFWHHAPRGKVAAYIALWPGMNAAAFLDAHPAGARPSFRELAAALTKLVGGSALVIWATVHAFDPPILVVGWAGMLGIIFCLHFGFFHIVSWMWRRFGVNAVPIMRAPVLATSLAEFWAERWNLAFADGARRFILRPLARRWGVRLAAAFVFFVSGLVHESVISLPARGGWGGPTLYFLLQAAGTAVEKSAVGRRFGLGAGTIGRGWTLLVTAVPVPLLFHAPFVERVIVPFFRFLHEAL